MIKWEDPPKTNTNPGIPAPYWSHDLRANPERWALVDERLSKGQAASRQHYISHGNAAWIREGERWEATIRSTDNGYYDLYARYMGKDE